MKKGKSSFSSPPSQGGMLDHAWDQALDGMRVIDESGIILEVNDAYCRMVEKQRDELLGQSFAIVYAEQNRADMFQKMIGRLSRSTVDTHLLRGVELWNGRRIWLEFRNSNMTLDGQKKVLLSIVTDITRRMVGEVNEENDAGITRDSEERFRQLLESSDDWVWEIDDQSTYTYSSHHVQQILGYAPEELIGRKPSDFIPPDEADSVAEAFREPWEKRQPLKRIRTVNRHKRGHLVFLETSGVPYFGGEGNFIGYRGITRDITEQKRAEDALQASEELHRRLFAAIPDGVVRADLEGNILFMNGKGIKLSRSSSELDLRGKNIFSFVAPEDRERALRNSKLVFDGPIGPRQYVLVAEDGSRMPVEVNSEILRYADGTPYEIVIVFRDISERKRAEEALRRTQRMESVGLLAGGIAHEFNNLLQAVMGQSYLALTRLPADSAARVNIEKAQKAAERAADLTQKLLAYSGRGKVNIGPIDVNAIIRENRRFLEVALPKNVRLELSLSDMPLHIEADANQIQQVLMNLVVNAGEAMEGRPGRIEISSSRRIISDDERTSWARAGTALNPGPYIVLEVADNGLGMDDATKGKLFDPFFSTKLEGRGLGLAAVAGIIRSHRGGLGVTSEKAKGSVFRMAFPPCTGAEQPEQRQASVDSSEIEATILLIDDEAAVRDTFVDTLEGAGLKIRTACDGETGLQIYEQHQSEIALVILDLSMPGIGGVETFRRLKSLNPDVRIVLSSGYAESEVVQDFKDLGLAGFLHKPYQWSDLIKTLSGYLRSIH